MCQNKSYLWRLHHESDLALTYQGLKIGPLGLSCGVWHQSIESCGLRVGASLDLTYSRTPHGRSIWGIRRPWGLCHIPQAVPGQFYECVWANCPASAAAAIWDCHPHLCLGSACQVASRFPRRTLHYNKMINVIHCELFVTFPGPSLSELSVAAGRTVLLGRPLFWSDVATRGCTWSSARFWWVVHVKWHPHECQDLRFPSRALHCY